MVRTPAARLRFREMSLDDLDEWQPVDGTPRLEVGHHLGTAFQGQGYVTEAAAACRDLARIHLGASEIVAIVHPGNLASRRVPEHIGMTRVEDDRAGGRTRSVLALAFPSATDRPVGAERA